MAVYTVQFTPSSPAGRPRIHALCDWPVPTNDPRFCLYQKFPSDSNRAPGVVSDSVLQEYLRSIHAFANALDSMGVTWPFSRPVDVLLGRSSVLGLGDHWSIADLSLNGGPYVLLPALDGREIGEVPWSLSPIVWFELTLLLLRGLGPMPTSRMPEWLWLMESAALWMASLAKEKEHLPSPKLTSSLRPFPVESDQSYEERLLLMRFLSAISQSLPLRLVSERKDAEHWFETASRMLGAKDVAQLYLARSTTRYIGTIIPDADQVSAAFQRPVRQVVLSPDKPCIEDRVENLSAAYFAIVCPEGALFAQLTVLSDACVCPYVSTELLEEPDPDVVDEVADEAQTSCVHHKCVRDGSSWRTSRIDLTVTTRILAVTLVNGACRGLWEKQFRIDFDFVYFESEKDASNVP